MWSRKGWQRGSGGGGVVEYRGRQIQCQVLLELVEQRKYLLRIFEDGCAVCRGDGLCFRRTPVLRVVAGFALFWLDFFAKVYSLCVGFWPDLHIKS